MTEHQGVERPLPSIVLHGSQEPIFQILPETVLANLRNPRSENALLWNRIYPLANPSLDWQALRSLRPLWGTRTPDDPGRDTLVPYFWGYAVTGQRLEALDDVLREVDGSGNPTEVDLFLLGTDHVVLIEAKHMSNFGRCGRYSRGRCPEVHLDPEQSEACRYWVEAAGSFSSQLAFGARPSAGTLAPPCDRHYQLARTTLVATCLGERLGLQPHVWVILPSSRWRALEAAWLDFVGRVQDDGLWRRMRVLGWESLEQLKTSSRS